MSRSVKFFLPLLASLAALAGCAPDYSPDTYASNAVQQANKVEPAIVIGFRQVAISASGTVGAISGGAAGGVLGAQAGSGGIVTALGGVGGAVVGSLVGTGIEHATSDTTGWEYIVRKPNGELLSVTQREPSPIPLGQKVLVITGSQARIVPDYSTPPPEPPTAEKSAPPTAEKSAPPTAEKNAPPTAEKKPEAAENKTPEKTPGDAVAPTPITPAAVTKPAPETPPGEATTPTPPQEKRPNEAAAPAPLTPAADPSPSTPASEPDQGDKDAKSQAP